MTSVMDKLTTCPCCGSDACYERHSIDDVSEIKTWLCMTCGFTSHTQMIEGSEFVQLNEQNTAELIKDLKQVHEGLAWFPTVVNIPEKGMVFPEGRSIQEWHWKVVKAIPVADEEKEKFPIPGTKGKYYKFKMDMKNPLVFDKNNFMDAAEAVGMFEA
jgi:hypothetical protein